LLALSERFFVLLITDTGVPRFAVGLRLQTLAPLIQCFSRPGDLVLDPLCGSGSTPLAARRLYEIAEAQQGFFTTKQAKAAGFAENTHPYHIQAGNWIREHRGIYRLASFPRGERPDLMPWSLWSGNRREAAQRVYSYQTALSHHDRSDVMPAKLHMTVPRGFRRNSKIPRVLVLHFADLPQSEIGIAHGVRVTRPMRTILDLLQGGEVRLPAFGKHSVKGCVEGSFAEAKLRRRGNICLTASNCEPFFRK
jgi:hypothetical protein